MADLDMISPEIRNQIISGKDVNLNLLLIPNYETPIKRKDQDTDERLSEKFVLGWIYHRFWQIQTNHVYSFFVKSRITRFILDTYYWKAQIWPKDVFEYRKMFSAMILQHIYL